MNIKLEVTSLLMLNKSDVKRIIYIMRKKKQKYIYKKTPQM